MSEHVEHLYNVDDFEQFVANIWAQRGWDTEVTQGSHDRGIDVIATKPDKKHLIQAKQWETSKKISSTDVRQYAGLIEQESNVDCVEIVTTAAFTQQAQTIAEDMNVRLVSGQDLVQIVLETDTTFFQDSDQQANMNPDDNDKPDSAHDLYDASEIAKQYTESFLDGEWNGIVASEDNGDEWWISFEVDGGSGTEERSMVITKEDGAVKSII